jgi:hypothetical protein
MSNRGGRALNDADAIRGDLAGAGLSSLVHLVGL